MPGGTSLDFNILQDAFAVTADGEIPGRAGLTQPVVEDILKGQMQDSSGWHAATDAAYGGLTPGVPLTPNIFMNLGSAITGLDLGTWPGSGPGGWQDEINNVLADVNNFFNNLAAMFGVTVDFNDVAFDVDQAFDDFFNELFTDPIQALVGVFTDPTWLFDIFSDISIGQLNLGGTNLILNPLFDDEDAVADDPFWTWDGTTTTSGSNSVKVTADGTVKELQSNTIKVTPGQTMFASIKVKWSGLTGTGSPIQFRIYKFAATPEGQWTPTGVPTILESVPFSANGGFVEIDGSYTVEAGVDGVGFICYVGDTATAGTVWFAKAFATKTGLLEQAWVKNLDEQFAGILDVFGLGFLDDLIAPDVEGIWSSIITDLLNPLALLQDIFGRDTLVEIRDGITNILEGIPFVGDWLADSWVALTAFFDDHQATTAVAENALADASTAQSAAETAQYSTETLSGFFNAPRVLPAYVGALADSVAFDRDSVDGTSTPTLGTLVLIPIKMTQDRIIDAIKIGCTATTMTNLLIGLYDADETTGDLTKVLDLGDRKADLDVAFSQQTFELTEAIALQSGELYYIGVLQVGGTAAALHRKSLGFNMSDGLFPKYLGSTWTTTGVSTLPASIANADVASGTRYWGALGTAAEPLTTGNVFLSDNFNRPNSSDLGPNWTTRNGNIGINSNMPATTFASSGVATHNTRLNSTSCQVGFTLTGGPGGDTVGASLRGNGLGPCVELICTATTGSTGVDPTGSVRIRTRSAYGSGVVNRAIWDTGSGAPQIGTWIFEAVGNTYSGYKNGLLKLQWVDSGGAFAVAGNNTEVGIFTTQDSFLVMDDWLARDL